MSGVAHLLPLLDVSRALVHYFIEEAMEEIEHDTRLMIRAAHSEMDGHDYYRSLGQLRRHNPFIRNVEIRHE